MAFFDGLVVRPCWATLFAALLVGLAVWPCLVALLGGLVGWPCVAALLVTVLGGLVGMPCWVAWLGGLVGKAVLGCLVVINLASPGQEDICLDLDCLYLV